MNLGLFVLMLVLACLLSEGLLRLKNLDQKNYNIEMWNYARRLKVRSPYADLGHEHRPNSKARLQGADIRINSLGLRGGEIEPLKPGQKRVLVLGSSNTLGWGVPEDQTMAALLQAGLGDRAQVLNAGIGNYNASRYVHYFERRLRRLKPDVVVVHYFVRDAEVIAPGGGNFLLRHSQFAVTLYHSAHNLSFGFHDPSKLVNHYRAMYAPESPGLAEMHRALERLDGMAKEDGFRVVLTMVPDIHAVTPYPFGFIHDHMRALAASLGWTYVDFEQALSRFPMGELFAMPGDPHINSKGQAAMAETLLPYLNP